MTFNTKLPKVAIIIVTYNSSKVISELLKSLSQTDYPKDRLITFIIDNASTDNTYEVITEIMKKIHFRFNINIIRLRKNFGFAGANNIALKLAKRLYSDIQFFILVNPDIIMLKKKWLKELIIAAHALGGNTILGAVLYKNYHKVDTIGEIFDPLGQPCSIMREMSARYLERVLRITRIPLMFIPNIWFALVVIPKKIIDSIGFLDEHYYMYFEDTEYCLRAWSHGYRCAILMRPIAIHKHGKSSVISEAWRKVLQHFWARNYLATICRYFNPITCLLRTMVQLMIGLITRQIYYVWTISNIGNIIKNVAKERVRLPEGLLLPWWDLRNYITFWAFKYILEFGFKYWKEAIRYGSIIISHKYLMRKLIRLRYEQNETSLCAT